MRSWLLVGRRCVSSPSSQVCDVGVAAVDEVWASTEFLMPKGIKPSPAEAPAPISSRRVVAIGRSLGYALPTMRASDRQHLPKQSFCIVSMRLAKKEATLTQPCVGQRDGACCSRREAEFSQVDGGKK